MIILAIDPGYQQSAWLAFDTTSGQIRDRAISSNDQLLGLLRGSAVYGQGFGGGIDRVVIEKVEGFGMAVGAEVFETVYWSGRFAEAANALIVERIGRRAVKLNLCGQARAKDPNVRQALIDRYGGSAAIGKKASPGPLYGIAGDLWSALAVACTWTDLQAGVA